MLKRFQRPVMTALAGVLLSATVSMVDVDRAHAGQPGAIVPLPPKIAAAAQQYLPGVVGDPIPSFTIDPSMAQLAAGTRTYQVVSGDNAGTTEQHVIAPLPRDTSGVGWRYSIGDRTAYLRLKAGESLSVTAEEDGDQGVITRYVPPEPLLVAGMNAGDKRSAKIQVKVFDLDDPTNLEHTGELNLTLTYVGAYKVTVPAGTFDAALLVWNYEGSVGPASVDDIQARFVVPDVGMVAAAEKRDIAAFLIYNDNSKVGKVLQQK